MHSFCSSVIEEDTVSLYQLWVRWGVMLCMTPQSDLPQCDEGGKKAEFPGGIKKNHISIHDVHQRKFWTSMSSALLILYVCGFEAVC